MNIWICILSLSYIQFVDAKAHCQQQYVSVSLPTSELTKLYEIATWFCYKEGTTNFNNKIVHLTIHGLTYDHTYWNFPCESSTYSYTDYVINKSNGNIVVLNFDRIGIGRSSHPPAYDVTIDLNADVVYQLTEKLHNGQFQDTKFDNIILVGHSLGTLISWTTASSDSGYNRFVNGLISTGWLHKNNPIGGMGIISSMYPVQLDPKLRQQNLPLGYLTTNPSWPRQTLFYNMNDADIGIVQQDEQLKETGTLGELRTCEAANNPLVTLKIPKAIPILLVIGQNDQCFCNVTLACDNSLIIQEREQQNFISSTETYVLQQAGHSINLHLNSHDWYQIASDWTQKYFRIKQEL
ncbi:unnamed protein product [Didymodactylos carnosus]|uniref:AB hydrolase-1 domain-containing protein n=1 Tax=Didymodactylos carnosus TaxID=1234261 RepID=A0A815XCG5_9BILA|nr:unnamed protein product [Didymodactylos carnosus]CAF1555786.1 unnamed protein product [Didymodactylos carnosus]CAF4155516.1 unnamed protein product [Didymodactylos carnosus]CAF4416862.1 unnamed protein product [Didymodactylos carnosus]